MSIDTPKEFKALVFAVNSEVELPDHKQNKPRPVKEQGFVGWPEKLPATIDGKPNKRRGLW
jgi:hypothetical protein